MEKQIRKIGNSQGVIISKTILDNLGIRIGDFVETKVRNGQIILSPRKQ